MSMAVHQAAPDRPERELITRGEPEPPVLPVEGTMHPMMTVAAAQDTMTAPRQPILELMS